jgi:hypothetical protein
LRAPQVALAALVVAILFIPASHGARSAADPRPADERLLAAVTALRAGADPVAQRAHVWATVRGLVAGNEPTFESWRGEGALYAPEGSPADDRPGMRGFDRPLTVGADAHGLGAPVITYTLYDPAAFDHIRAHGLQRRATLERLRSSGARTAPAFPADAAILKTAWWPVAAKGLTALPVWDGKTARPGRRGNPYVGWPRVVAVDPSAAPDVPAAVSVAFMGETFRDARRVFLSDFHHVQVDGVMAERLSRDPESRRAAAIALGRPVAAGDFLVLVGLNLMTHEQEDWVWAALWWHDRPQAGAFAQGRPADLSAPWDNYLMQAAFDAVTPLAADGGPHVAFNPWLEARFPDGGQGGGTESNCLACHQRASYPAAPFLPVTRGKPDPDGDPALAKDRLPTRFMWSIAMHAQP